MRSNRNAIEDRMDRYEFLAPGEHFTSRETPRDRDLEDSPQRRARLRTYEYVRGVLKSLSLQKRISRELITFDQGVERN